MPSRLRRVVGGDRARAGPFADPVAGGVAGFGGELAVLDVDDQVPAAAGVEAERRLAALARAEGVLELVAVAPLLGRRHDLLQLEAVEAAEPAQRLADLLLLVGELALVGEALPGGAGAGLAAVDAAVGEAVGARRAAARPCAPRRSASCLWSPRPGRGRRAARRRRRRRSRRRGRGRDRRRRASRSRPRAARRDAGRGPPAWGRSPAPPSRVFSALAAPPGSPVCAPARRGRRPLCAPV